MNIRNDKHAWATAPFLDCEQLFLHEPIEFYEVENSTMLVGLKPTTPRLHADSYSL